MSDKIFFFNFGNNGKYHYTAVAKANTLLAKFLSNRDSDKFCLSCFDNFENKELIKKQRRFYENSNYIYGSPPQKKKKKFEIVSNKSTGEKIEVPANILKYLFRSKSLYHYETVAYDFERILGK